MCDLFYSFKNLKNHTQKQSDREENKENIINSHRQLASIWPLLNVIFRNNFKIIFISSHDTSDLS